MKIRIILLTLFISSGLFAQSDVKSAFQKGKYEMALSYYNKAEYVEAIELFSLAAKIKPENIIGQEAAKKVDTLREILRNDIKEKLIGTWKKIGDKPIWGVINDNEKKESSFEEIIEVKENEVNFFEIDNATHVKKLIKTERLVYTDKDVAVSLFSEVVLSDGRIWNCMVNEDSKELRVVNVGIKTEKGIKKIDHDNLERYYIKI